MQKKLTIQNNNLGSMAGLRPRFYHPINEKPKISLAPTPWRYYILLFLFAAWCAGSRSDSLWFFP